MQIWTIFKSITSLLFHVAWELFSFIFLRTVNLLMMMEKLTFILLLGCEWVQKFCPFGRCQQVAEFCLKNLRFQVQKHDKKFLQCNSVLRKLFIKTVRLFKDIYYDKKNGEFLQKFSKYFFQKWNKHFFLMVHNLLRIFLTHIIEDERRSVPASGATAPVEQKTIAASASVRQRCFLAATAAHRYDALLDCTPLKV